MELINATRMVAGYNVAVEPSGRELLVVVVKGTFQMPRLGERVRLADEQVPLVMSDTFTGTPGLSAPLYEADFAARKRHCDVLLVGAAYAPDRRPVSRLTVGMQVAKMSKTFGVIGEREWWCRLGGTVSPGPPRPFERMPVSYDRAFGGVDNHHDDPLQHAAFVGNPAGRGFHKHLRPEWVDGSPLPNTEAVDQVIGRPDSLSYQPMSFGPVGRGWPPRRQYAGTYDATWLEEDFPFLPADFSEEFHQAAPSDQQMPFPVGGEEVRLLNLSTQGNAAFTLPQFDASIEFYSKKAGRENRVLLLDTIVFEPDEERFTLTWRVTRELRSSVFEVLQAVVGRRPQIWWVEHDPVPLAVDPEPGATGEPEPDAVER